MAGDVREVLLKHFGRKRDIGGDRQRPHGKEKKKSERTTAETRYEQRSQGNGRWGGAKQKNRKGRDGKFWGGKNWNRPKRGWEKPNELIERLS